MLPFLLFFVMIVAAFRWLLLRTHLPLWADVLIILPATLAVLYSLRGHLRGEDTRDSYSDVQVPKWVRAASVVCAFGTLGLAFRAAGYLVLVYKYGLARVRSEHLHFTSTAKGHPWIVSNGDQLADVPFIHYLMSLGIWFALMFLVVVILMRFVPARRSSD